MSVYRNPYDWCDYAVPDNVQFGSHSFIESAYCFRQFFSRRRPGLILGDSAMICEGTDLVVGENGVVELGDYAMLTSVYVRCEERITIGKRVMISWSVGIFDTEVFPSRAEERAAAISRSRQDTFGRVPCVTPRPVVIEDDAWIGFGSILLPGVRIGAKSIVGAKSVVHTDIPPGVIAAGNPARVIRAIAAGEIVRQESV
ncbi:MAG: transferase hexapeptide repeat containing protein [Chthonomonadaceae bacterium]|nr:transferase hexapeptide repeat containing protein [Chthonomonadaceae bacterium]